MLKKQFFILILLFLTLPVAKGQHVIPRQADSLKQALSMEKKDTGRVMEMARISEAYRGAKPDSAMLYGQEALELARQIDFAKGEATALLALSVLHRELGNLPTALNLALTALRIAESKHLAYEERFALARVANVYVAAKNFPVAITYFHRVIEKNKAASDRISLAVTQMLTADAYEQSNKLDSAYWFIQAVYPHMNLIPTLPVAVFRVLGNIEARKNNTSEAIKYYHKSVETGIKVNDLRTIASVYSNIAQVYKKINNRDSAIKYAKLGLDYGQKLSLQNRILSAGSLLAELFEASDAGEALRYHKIADAAKDSLYGAEKVQQLQAMALQEQDRQRLAEEKKLALQNTVRQYALLGGLGIFLAIALVLYRSNKLKQKAYELLQKQKVETDRQKIKVEETLQELKITQAQLIQKEKMASLGELTAGIAHEIQNPLNFVNNFSDVNKELIAEMKEEIDKGNTEEVKAIANDLEENEQKINHHGKRADAIVKGMLQHSRSNTGKKEPTGINALAEEYLRLSYHGLKAKDKDFDANFKTCFDESIGKIEVAPQDIGRVLLNLYNNAFYAVNEKKKQLNGTFEPTVEVSTKRAGDKVELSVKDNGTGIPQNVLDKIYQPFFTTKPTGQGTGLGLSLSYDLITKGHSGELKVETNEGEGVRFVIQLPYSYF